MNLPIVFFGGFYIVRNKHKNKDALLDELPHISLFDNINQIAYVADPQTFEILYVNKFFKDLLGQDPIGKKCYEAFQNLDHPCGFCTNKKILENKYEPFEWEYHNPVLDRDFLITDQIIKWTDGRDVRFEFAVDITELKQKEKSLRDSEERFRLAQKAADIGSWDWNIETNELFWSDEIESIFGLKKGEFDNKYKSFLNLIYPEDRKYVVDSIEKCIDKNVDYDIEHRIVWSDGSIHWVRESGNVIRNDNGKPSRMVGIVQNITEQKMMENKLIEMYTELDKESRRLKTILENAPEGIIITDKNSRIIFCNKIAEQLYNRPIPIGKDYHSHASLCILDADGKTIEPEKLPLTRSALKGEIIKGEELGIKWSDGQIRHMIVNTSPIKNKDHEIVGAVGLLQDISERKRIEQKITNLNSYLIRQTAELSSVNDELEAFSYSVSHDLRSPLRSIDGFSQAILEDYENKLDEEGRDYLRRIRNATQRMGELIDGLLKLSRITRHQIDYKTVDISAMADSIINSLKKNDPNRQVVIKIHENLKVKGDEHLLRIALENLINNAWKFSKDKETTIIEVGKTRKDDEEIFYIKDNGAGFNMNYVDKLFIPFQRLHTNDEFEGTGIGLGIVKRVINRHGGKIWAESQNNKGSTFYFTLSTILEDSE